MCTNLTERCTKTHDKTPINSCCKEHLIELLDFTTNLLDEHGIKYWLDYGTLLGATRNGKLIPWDDDCDISFFMEDESKVRDLLKANTNGYWLYETHNPSTFFSFRYSAANELHIDLFPWFERDRFMHRRNYLDNVPISPDAKKGKHFPKSYVATLERIKLEDKFYWAPNNPITFCQFRYGKAWETPLTVAEWNTTINPEKNKIVSW